MSIPSIRFNRSLLEQFPTREGVGNMRALKLLVLTMFMVASLGLTACTGTDMSGTAGEPAPVAPGEGVEPGEGEPGEEQKEKADPGSPAICRIM